MADANETTASAPSHRAAPDPSQLVLASNRLPVRLEQSADGFSLQPSTGGLATALGGLERSSMWVGWSGSTDFVDDEAAGEFERLGLVPVSLDDEEKEGFYDRVCNETLWPLFHTFPDRMRISDEAWTTYVEVNRRFASRIAETAGEGGDVWVHDFHLMLVPALLRKLRPDVKIGFFLHIPFPTFEVYRLLPPRRMILAGLLGADLVSFQTSDDADHFRDACRRVLGVRVTPTGVEASGREVSVAVDPIGIDAEGFRAALGSPAALEEADDLRRRYADRRLILGVERLDYTKGIPQKLHAFERLLDEHPNWARSTTFLQVLVPSRLESPDYQDLRTEIELKVAGINGRHARPGVTPVEYVHREVSREALAALYRRADVMLVTPLRDGMNLVAHEFVFCQTDDGPGPSHRGTLILSELAGAAQVLPEATIVNPWDVMGVARALEEAQAIGRPERVTALDAMRRTVDELECRRWANRFLERLGGA